MCTERPGGHGCVNLKRGFQHHDLPGDAIGQFVPCDNSGADAASISIFAYARLPTGALAPLVRNSR